jgi:hypothetical protein
MFFYRFLGFYFFGFSLPGKAAGLLVQNRNINGIFRDCARPNKVQSGRSILHYWLCKLFLKLARVYYGKTKAHALAPPCSHRRHFIEFMLYEIYHLPKPQDCL